MQAIIINSMEAKINNDNFETYWAEHKSELIACAPQHLRQERENALKMNTAGDWLLAAGHRAHHRDGGLSQRGTHPQ